MGKFTAIQTYDRFQRLWEQNKISDRSLNFILDTGQLYTHGIFLNSVAYGTEANGATQLTIAGTTKNLSLSNHTHSNYLEKNANINLGAYKIVSGQKDLLYYSGGNTYLGDTSTPAIILGTSLSTVRDNHTYTVLDTGNFSIGNTTLAQQTFNNVAVFKYGSNSYQLDYVKRLNTTSTFDTLATYTSAGTTQVNNKQYGFLTLYTDHIDNIIGNPSWAQFRVDIAGQLVQFRTSKDSTQWINLNQIEVPLNALNVAGIVAAPTSADANKVWKTDNSGNPGWRDASNTWRNIRINDEETDSLGTDTGTGALYIKQGTGIGVAWSGNKIVISNSSPNTDKTGVKKGTAGATATADNTLISVNSSSGIIFEGGTNQFKVGNGTNSITIGVAHGLSTKNININGTNYAIYTSAGSLPTIKVPTAFGTAGQVLATNSSANGFTWVAANAHTHTNIVSLNNKSANDLSDTYPVGLSTHGIYNNDYPIAYGCGITSRGNNGAFQIAGQWNNNVTSLDDYDKPTEMYIRGRRDSYNVWTTWTRVVTDRNFSSIITASSIGAAPTSHSHSNYLSIYGGTMNLGEGLKFHGDNNYFGENADARIISLLDSNGATCDGGLIIDERGTNNGTETVTELLRIRHNEFKWKGTNISLEGHTHDDRYVTAVNVGTGNNANKLYYTKNNTNTYFTIPFATNTDNASNSDKVDNFHVYPEMGMLYYTSKSVTMNTTNAYWYVKIELSAYAKPPYIIIECDYNNERDRALLEFSGFSVGYIYRNNNQNQGNIKAISNIEVRNANEAKWLLWIQFDKIYNNSNDHYHPSDNATCTVYLGCNDAGFNVSATTTEPSNLTWTSTGSLITNLIIKNTTIYGNLVGNADTATTAAHVTWSGITSKPSAIGSVNQPVYWNGSGFTLANAYPTKSSWNYDDVYLKLSGGTMTGDIDFSNMNYNINWKVNYLSGWARSFIAFYQHTDSDSTKALENVFNIGSCGFENGYAYTWMGNGSYDSESNLRFNKNGSITIGANAILHAGNSSVSKSGETLTVKIGGTTQTLTNTWRGIQDNLTSSTNTTQSLSAKQGYLLATGFARDSTKQFSYTYGTTGTTTKIKININTADVRWMLSFVVTLYQGYRSTKVMISGYNYGNQYWYGPKAVILGDTESTTIKVYFGYDELYQLWVGFDGSQYTGVCITDVCNGYMQITPSENMFSIANVTDFGGTLQTTITPVNPYLNTWIANAVGVAGYVSAPTKAANANMTWQTDAEGIPAWRASNNHSHSYLPLSGSNYNTLTDTNPFTISRLGGTSEAMQIMVNDSRTLFQYTNDEYSSSIIFQLINTDTESSDGSRASDRNVTISSNNTGISLSVGGTQVSLNGHKHAYTDLTGSSTTANQAIVSNGTANGWTLKTLGSHAFDSTTYATPDTTTTLTRASGNLTKDAWSDVGTFADSIAEGAWVIQFTIDGSLYSGIFSRKKNDTMSEEISLHAAGTSTRRIYARTTGNKIQIATSDNTFNPGAITFNFRKLV